MQVLLAVLAGIAVLTLVVLALSLRIVQQYEEGVLFRLGRVVGLKKPGLVRIVPVIDVLRRVSLRIVTLTFLNAASWLWTTCAVFSAGV